jgi:hypothetical protein
MWKPWAVGSFLAGTLLAIGMLLGGIAAIVH